jgi:hypothetical protein
MMPCISYVQFSKKQSPVKTGYHSLQRNGDQGEIICAPSFLRPSPSVAYLRILILLWLTQKSENISIIIKK